ncbi:MAG: DNA translocase FtsK 4TM domain-containing protein [Oscillospiraceae bacterium]|nr:DNA translocase FtsK 4TM domain-containing protein [Oscillospiraceae bacterium]
MAQSTNTSKKNTGAGKSGSSSKSRKSVVNSAPPPEPARPIRREVGAVIFLFLAVFTVISYFNNEGTFIVFFTDLLLGLVGWGFWICAPVFFLISFILFFHRGRPVALRVTSAILLPILFAAMANLMFCQPETENFDIALTVGHLFEQGQDYNSGGVLGGLIAIGLEMAFSIYGAFPVLLLSFLFFLITALNSSINSIAAKLAGKPHAKYDPSMYEKKEVPAAQPAVKSPKTSKKTAAAQKQEKPIERLDRRMFPVDIPLGDDEDVLTIGDELPPAGESKAALKKAKVKKRGAEQAADTGTIPAKRGKTGLSSLPLDDDFDDFPIEKSEPLKPITMRGEISDPPKNTKKLKRAEIDEEAKNMAETISASAECSDYEFPPLDLLRSGVSASADGREEIAINRSRLEGAIRSFGISAGIVGVIRGPTVTRYDVELDQGVKLSRVTNLAGDLALALGVINVRIAPIPDKISTVGIEVPNKIVSTVYLRDILESSRFSGAKSKLSFALGKDIGGDCIVGNIAKLPHMLIAGTTGSGKSVCMNSLILSLLYKARPDEVRLIMIDPKMVELGVYNGIPHLYVPVVTDPKKAAGALQWSVVEMLKRYRLFSEVGVRDLEAYNRHCAAVGDDKLPQIVIVIDELADLMLVASKDVEESICRVAQMGRAAGMHLVIATQRPSADVITGLMKANIPSRIAFAVSSAMESRIILDQSGAEKLVGMGDMLYSPVGCGKPVRIQGAFVSDEEREDVIQFIKEGSVSTEQNKEIEEFMNKAVEEKSSSDGGKTSDTDRPAGNFDEMLPQAVEVILETKACSVSMLQRRVKLGYSRAARIVDQMEELGIVGPYEGAKPRAVLVDREGWHDIQVQLGLVEDDSLPELPEDEY